MRGKKHWLKFICSSVFALAVRAVGCSVIMPLSSDQVAALKNPDTKIAFQDQNPKKGFGSMHWGRYENTKNACPLEELQLLGQTGKI